jgi:hypothetical protein
MPAAGSDAWGGPLQGGWHVPSSPQRAGAQLFDLRCLAPNGRLLMNQRFSFFCSVPMTVVGIEMAVGMRMPHAVRVLMLMLVEYDLQTPPEGIGNSAEGFYAWDMVATFKARDHGLGHL